MASVNLPDHSLRVEEVPLVAASELDDAERTLLKARITRRLDELNAVLVAHYYVDGDIQDLADATGGHVADSLEMARFGHASDAETLPPAVNAELRTYYDTVSGWLGACIREGREDGSITLPGNPDDTALLVMATIQGAAVAARCMKSRTHFDAAVGQLRIALAPAHAPT